MCPVGLREDYHFAADVENLRSKISYLSGYGSLHYMITESDPEYPYRHKLDELVNELREEFFKVFPLMRSSDG